MRLGGARHRDIEEEPVDNDVLRQAPLFSALDDEAASALRASMSESVWVYAVTWTPAPPPSTAEICAANSASRAARSCVSIYYLRSSGQPSANRGGRTAPPAHLMSAGRRRHWQRPLFHRIGVSSDWCWLILATRGQARPGLRDRSHLSASAVARARQRRLPDGVDELVGRRVPFRCCQKSTGAGAIVSSSMRAPTPSFSLMRFSISFPTSGFSRRKVLAFSLP